MTGIQDTLFDMGITPGTPSALTVRQPWASLIIAGIKDVENRGKPTSRRGTILIHAGLGTSPEGMRDHGGLLPGYPAGVIIGAVDIIGCVRDSRSEWAMDGCWHWLLANPRACDPVPAGGALSFWKPESGDWDRVQATLAA